MQKKIKGGVLPQVTIEQIVGIFTILVILFGCGVWTYDYLRTPHFEPQHNNYASAYFQYDDIENYLYIEVIPDGHGKAILAACDALLEVADHRWINHDIADKPIRVTLGWREDTNFIPYVYWVEYPEDMDKMIAKDCLRNSTRAVKHFTNKVYVDPSVDMLTMYGRYLLTINNSTVTVIPMEEVTEYVTDGDNPTFTDVNFPLG